MDIILVLFSIMVGIIFGADNGDELVVSVKPTPTTIFGTRGGAILEDDSLWIADTGHHRLLGWKTLPTANNQPADIVLGQKDFWQVDHNQTNYFPIASGLNMPYGISSVGD